ncbi:MAG: hypothetical protein IPK97_11150 [Ahniella sp.]|nr:hypothetical protein [Ahniella sp.]
MTTQQFSFGGYRSALAWHGVLAFTVLCAPMETRAYSLGYAGGNACSACHTGGSNPLTAFSGPLNVPIGSTRTLSLDVTRMSSQALQAGVNVRIVSGGFATLSEFTSELRTENGQITHAAPLAFSANTRSVDFRLTANPGATCNSVVLLNGAAVAADGNNGFTNDGAASTTRSITLTCPATLAATASADITLGSGSLTDAVTITGRFAPSGGNVDFLLYGPNDSTCSGAVAFSSLDRPISAGGVATSQAYVPSAAGTYVWRAIYSGDANNVQVGTNCSDASQSVVVARTVTTIVAQVSPTSAIRLGQGTLRDQAQVSGLAFQQPGGTFSYRLYGPGDTSCTNTPVFQNLSVPYPVGPGAVLSAAYTPTEAGNYRWRVTYSGDSNNGPATQACGLAPQTAVVDKALPVLTAVASSDIVIGDVIFTSAALAGRLFPPVGNGGQITFQLFGPTDTACTNTPLFSMATPYPAAGVVLSDSYTPLSPGTYRWRTYFNGDSNNEALSSVCNQSGQTVVVRAEQLFANGFED